MNKCIESRVDLYADTLLEDDDVALKAIPLGEGDSFVYDVTIVKKPFTFEFNKRRLRITLNVDLKMKDVREFVAVVGVRAMGDG